MIAGIGHDVCDVRRIAGTLARFGDRFTRRVFTERERRRCDARRMRAAGYARRFAAKEACAKALGTGMRQGVRWRDLEVVNLPGGKPILCIRGPAFERLWDIVPSSMEPVVHLTLSDDRELAYAVVLITAVPGMEEA